MSTGIVFQQMLMIFILMMSGYVMSVKGFFPKDSEKAMSALVLYLCNPSLLIVSVLNRDPSVTTGNVLICAGAAAAMYAILVLAGIVVPRLLGAKGIDRGHYNMMCIFGNTGFIGLPLVQALIGGHALIYVAIVNLFYNLLFYTYGYYLVDLENRSSFQWKKLINVGTITSVTTILLFFTQPKLPSLVPQVLTYWGNGTTLLAMIVIGISLSQMSVKELFGDAKAYLFIGLRSVAVPLLVSVLLKRLVQNQDLYFTLVIMASVPIGNIPLMLARERNVDGRLLSRTTVLSTILSVLTIPLVLSLS